MARSVRTLPLASVSGGNPEFSPTNEQWKQIERAYGHALSDNVRQDIVAATINFLLFEPFERAAEPVSLARERVLTVQKAAKCAHDALVTAPIRPGRGARPPRPTAAACRPEGVPAPTEEEQPPTEGEPKPQSAVPPVAQPVAPPPEQVPPDEPAVTATSTFYAHHLIKWHFADETFWSRKFRGRNDKFVRLRRVLVSLLDACTSALAELDDPNLPGHREGECWRGWVLELTRIAKQHKLPIGARTDTTHGPSPFVELVRELQRYVLPEARRHTHSYEALAKAIQRARRGGGVSAHSRTISRDLGIPSDESLYRYATR